MNTHDLEVASLSTTGSSRQTKHMALEDRLNYLSCSVDRLQDLIDQISGSDMQPERPQQLGNEKIRQHPSLVATLNEAPERIHSIAARLEDQINCLRDMLF